MADEPLNRNMATPLVRSDVASIDTDDAMIQLVEERLSIDKRVVAGGTVKVSTRTETHDEIAEVMLDRAAVEVERVPIDRAIDAAPAVRHDGDTMIVPVVEERLVITKQLYLVEELHIHQRLTQEMVKTPVALRRQHAVIERTDADGKTMPAEPFAAEPGH